MVSVVLLFFDYGQAFATLAQLKDRPMPTITLYHGTARDFVSFAPRFALRGTEPNSALGIHLTGNPRLAADYAELAAREGNAGTPKVLVVEARISRVALCDSEVDYLGRGDDDAFEATRPASDFVAARLRLQDEGFDAVMTDVAKHDLADCWAILDPSRILIVESVTADEARSLEDADIFGIDCEAVRLHDDGINLSL